MDGESFTLEVRKLVSLTIGGRYYHIWVGEEEKGGVFGGGSRGDYDVDVHWMQARYQQMKHKGIWTSDP